MSTRPSSRFRAVRQGGSRVAAAAQSLIESLEVRRLMHDGMQLNVNFQPSTSLVPTGFVADVGQKFGDRGNGFSYGWDKSNTKYARERTSPATAAPEYRTHQDMYRSEAGTKWEIVLPNGTYTVHLVAGDPAKTSGADYRIEAEGTRVLKGKPTAANPWVESSTDVVVKDGRLTLKSASNAVNNRLCFVEIREVHTHDRPVVSVSASAPRALETGQVPGTFWFSRAGDISAAMTVPYAISGSATADADYLPLSGSVTFPAGASDVQVNVVPKTDDLVEGDETVTVTLATTPGAAYDIGTAFAATVTIEDANQVVAKVLRWRRAADAPVAQSEAQSASVGGKLYVFSGYVDTTYKPTRRVDAFDPVTNKWTRRADMPVGLTHAGTVVDGAYVYFVGGYPEGATSQSFATKTVYRYDTVANTWDRLADLPQSRGGGAAALVGRQLHFFGGSDASRNDRTEHWSLDLSDPSAGWVARPPMQNARNHFGSETLGSRFHVIGGQTGQGDTATYQSVVNVFDTATNTWSAAASLLPVRSHIGHATFVRDGRILVMGGDGAGGARLSLVSEYDPASNTWKALTPLPAARKGGVGGLVGDALVFSGGNNGGVQRTTWIGEWV